jgi:hypothetical protein
VQVKQGENINVTTSENLKVKNVKAKNVQGQQLDLIPLPNNMWSLQNLVPGVYLLDVIVDMSSSGILGVYETVSVILLPDQTPLLPSTVINQITIRPPPSGGCPGNLTLIDGECMQPSPPPSISPEPCPTPSITPCPTPPVTVTPPVTPPEDGEEPPPDEVPPDSDDGTNGNGNDNGDGEDGSNGDGEDGSNGPEENGGGLAGVPPFG